MIIAANGNDNNAAVVLCIIGRSRNHCGRKISFFPATPKFGSQAMDDAPSKLRLLQSERSEVRWTKEEEEDAENRR